MGIFDKLKQAKNYLSGGGAKLSLLVDEREIASKGLVKLKVLCVVEEYEVFVDKLYINIRAEETVKNIDHGHSGSQHHNTHGQNRTRTVTTFKNEIIIDENFRLDPMGEYEWDAEFNIPPNLEGTYKGVNAKHEWKARAGLSRKGNDPNSKWMAFEV